MGEAFPPLVPRPMPISRLQVGNIAFFHIREDEMDKVIGIHDFASRIIFLFEGRHRHARQKFRQYAAIVSEASLERFDDIYTLHGAEAWFSYAPGVPATPQYLNLGSLTVKDPVLVTSVAYPDLKHTLFGDGTALQRNEMAIVTIRTKVRS